MQKVTAERGLVSAIIPVHNAERFVQEAVESVLDQTYPAIECIVVDDGSTDGSGEILRDFKDQILLLRLPPSGVSKARNMAIREAAGEFIAFLDADDLWLPRKIEEQVRAFRSHPQAALVYTGFHLVAEDLRFLGRVEPVSPERVLENSLLLGRPPLGLAQTGMVRRWALDNVGYFDEALSTSADADLVWRISSRFPVVRVAEALAMYRLHGNQMHHDPEITRIDRVRLFEKAFSSPVVPMAIRNRRREAYANLHVSLAARYLRKSDFPSTAKNLLRAFLLDPRSWLRAFRRLMTPGGGFTRR